MFHPFHPPPTSQDEEIYIFNTRYLSITRAEILNKVAFYPGKRVFWVNAAAQQWTLAISYNN